MQQSILFKAPGRSSKSPIVILRGIDLCRKSSTNHFRNAAQMVSRTLSMAWCWTRCNCTPRRLIRALFSARMSTVVAGVCVAAIWWHNITIADTIEAQKAVAYDVLFAMPWGIVWAIRATRMPLPEEGGEL